MFGRRREDAEEGNQQKQKQKATIEGSQLATVVMVLHKRCN